MMKKAFSCVVAVCALASPAWAGWKFQPISVSVSATGIQGWVSATRNTSNSVEYIHTLVWTSGGVTYGSVSAKDPAGTSKACTTTNGAIVAVIAGIQADSKVYVLFDASGTCTFIHAGVDSSTGPKQP